MTENLIKLLATGQLDIPFSDPELGGESGQFAVPVKATANDTGEPTFLKFEVPNIEAYRKECFEREVRMLRLAEKQDNVVRLKHPLTIVSCDLDIPALPMRWNVVYRYFGMEMCSGSFAEYIAQPQSFGKSLRLYRDIAKGLGQLHRLGICHRDLKPANCLLSKRGALVGDLGTATTGRPEDRLGDGDRYGQIPKGDTYYVAPECFLFADDLAALRKADFYSLGCVLYEMCTGSILWDTMEGIGEKLTALALHVHKLSGKQRDRLIARVLTDMDRSELLSKIRFQPPVPDKPTWDHVRQLHGRLCRFNPKDRLVDMNEVLRRIDGAVAQCDDFERRAQERGDDD